MQGGTQKKHSKRTTTWSWCVVVIILQLVSLVSAASRPFAPHDGKSPTRVPHSLNTKQGILKGMEGQMVNQKWLRIIGSQPPKCDGKCGGCVPCEAVQVPTTNDRFTTQYSNYEPEGWKCRCQSSFYNP